MDPLSISASVLAIMQMADRIIGLCKTYIEAVRDAPSDLRAILIEISTIKSLLENLRFLSSCDSGTTALTHLTGDSGPIEGCKRAVSDIAALFPPDHTHGASGSSSKRRRVKPTLEALAWPFKKTKAQKLLDEIGQHKTTISLALTTESSRDIKEIKCKTDTIHTTLTNLERHGVYQWLRATDPSPLHHRACKLYEPETGNWMLRSDEWISWIEGKIRCVWIHGVPGAGKTTLASHLIEAIKELCEDKAATQKYAYVYYYCYFGHNQNEAAPFIKWTLNQLCRQADMVPPHLHKLYKHGGEPSLVDLLRSLEAIVEAFDSIYLVVDAIDESTERAELLAVVRDLVTDARFEKVHVIATSREYIDIEKVMYGISAPVSMRNPLLDEDIKLYIQSQLHTHPRLSLWPSHLQDEISGALSSKAKGMFRWVVCQIDVLQRLRPDRSIIRDALINLPRTLDETYERIFLQIPEEARIFVHHTLRWIYCHGEVWNQSASGTILLQAIQTSLSSTLPSIQGYVFDEELLREFCGCLITITSNQIEDQDSSLWFEVSFAHYTVLEFLQSSRIWNGPTAFFGIDKETSNLEFAKMVMLEALHPQHNELSDWESNDKLVEQALGDYFGLYCTVSSIILLKIWGRQICRKGDLVALACDLLDPLKPHFEILKLTMRRVSIEFIDLPGNFEPDGTFWTLTWHELPVMNHAVILLNLLYTAGSMELVGAFLKNVNAKEVLRSQLDLSIALYRPLEGYPEFHFRGSIVELCAQPGWNFPVSLNFLLDFEVECHHLSKVLLSFAGWHMHETHCKDKCPLLRLLQLGAAPTMTGYRIGPLQMAVAAWDFEGVKLLLEAGADANDTGDKDGIEWGEDTTLNAFREIRDHSPLCLIRYFPIKDWLRPEEIIEARKDRPEQIEALLLEYGARDFTIGEELSEEE